MSCNVHRARCHPLSLNYHALQKLAAKHSQEQIAALYIFGFVSAMVSGPLLGGMADQHGRKRMCQVFCVLYSLSCCTKVLNHVTSGQLCPELLPCCLAALDKTTHANSESGVWKFLHSGPRSYPWRCFHVSLVLDLRELDDC